jgi:hypothetical protein
MVGYSNLQYCFPTDDSKNSPELLPTFYTYRHICKDEAALTLHFDKLTPEIFKNTQSGWFTFLFTPLANAFLEKLYQRDDLVRVIDPHLLPMQPQLTALNLSNPVTSDNSVLENDLLYFYKDGNKYYIRSISRAVLVNLGDAQHFVCPITKKNISHVIPLIDIPVDILKELGLLSAPVPTSDTDKENIQNGEPPDCLVFPSLESLENDKPELLRKLEKFQHDVVNINISYIDQYPVFPDDTTFIQAFSPNLKIKILNSFEITGDFLNAADPVTKLSSLYWMTLDENNVKILLKCLENNYEPLKEVTNEAFLTLNNEPGFYKNTSALYNLAETTTGRILLYILLKNNPKLAKEITAEVLYSQRNEESTEGGTSAFYWLTTDDIGIVILNFLFKINPALIVAITPAAFYTRLSANAEEAENMCAAFHLTTSKNKIEMLAYLLDTNETLDLGFTADVLCTQLPAVCYRYASPIANLAINEAGREFLLDILPKKNLLAKGIKESGILDKPTHLKKTLREILQETVDGQQIIKIIQNADIENKSKKRKHSDPDEKAEKKPKSIPFPPPQSDGQKPGSN